MALNPPFDIHPIDGPMQPVPPQQKIRQLCEDEGCPHYGAIHSHPPRQATGGFVSYYLATVAYPQRDVEPYQAECEDIIQALNMTFDEGCEFKAIWRTAAARLGSTKSGHDAVYDAEKRTHYANRALLWEQRKRGN